MENGGDVRSVSPTDISQDVDAREIVGIENCAGFPSLLHRRCEPFLASCSGSQKSVAKDLIERGVASLNTVDDFAPRPELLVARH